MEITEILPVLYCHCPVYKAVYSLFDNTSSLFVYQLICYYVTQTAKTYMAALDKDTSVHVVAKCEGDAVRRTVGRK